MQSEYRIHPSIGIARLGNSQDEFYLAPKDIGKRPIMCNEWGDESFEENDPKSFVQKYKDSKGRVKKQAAKFWIYKYDEKHPHGVRVDMTKEFKEFKWTVHLANKKAAWYEFMEFQGDLMKGSWNSYEEQKVPLRNSSITGSKRQKLIIDAGPRTLSKPHTESEFAKSQVPASYRQASFPKKPLIGFQINTLGEIKTDSGGNLIVLGGNGNSGGNEGISSFGGADSWNDDTSDGSIRCHVKTNDGREYDLDAWVVVGSPNFAPEIVNITTLDDLMFDVAVRKLNAAPQVFDKNKAKEYGKAYNANFDVKMNEIYNSLVTKVGTEEAKKQAKEQADIYAHEKAGLITPWKWGWNPDYNANYKQDIEPIIRRPAGYRWVANVPSMVDFIAPPFDTKDASKENESNRRRYFSYWRRPGYTEPGASRSGEKTDSHTMHNYGQRTKLFSDDDFGKGIPLMPVNSGSNVITDAFVDKFATLSSTQYRLLKQWAYGKFVCDDDDAIKFKDERGISMVHPLDRASVGNCVGTPMCPGIEVTWSIRNHHIYSGPYRIKHKEIDDITGLNPYYDETKITSEGKYDGCEPGDLTKRMANPWQSDLFQCNLDHVTFRDDSDEYNKDGKENPDPPTYVAYWWPPSAPWDVISGIETAEEQMDAGWIAAGRQVRYTRGINDIVDMVYGWSYMGFIVNQNDGSDRDLYQYFVEKERNHKEFVIGNVEWVTRKIKIKNKEKKKRIPKFDESFYEPTFSLKRKPPVK